MRLRLIIPGTPMPQQRHRHRVVVPKDGRKPFASMYDPSAKDKEHFRLDCKPFAPAVPSTQLVIVTFAFWMPVPKSYPKHFHKAVAHADEMRATKESAGGRLHLRKYFVPDLAHLVKPDVDNLVKFVLDSLNKLYWKDDSVVAISGAYKQYSTKPRTELQIHLLGVEQ